MAIQDTEASIVCQSHKNSLTDGRSSLHQFPLHPWSSTHGPLPLRSFSFYCFTILMFPESCKSIICYEITGLNENNRYTWKPLGNCSSNFEMLLWHLFIWHRHAQNYREVWKDFGDSEKIRSIYCHDDNTVCKDRSNVSLDQQQTVSLNWKGDAFADCTSMTCVFEPGLYLSKLKPFKQNERMLSLLTTTGFQFYAMLNVVWCCCVR